MVTTKLIPVLAATLASVLASCSADSAATTPPTGPCKPEAAQALVGKPKPTDAEALQLTNSKSVRQIEPGQMVTQDFREDRVTIETDPTTGKVVAARCG
jgi:hypothetical protein